MNIWELEQKLDRATTRLKIAEEELDEAREQIRILRGIKEYDPRLRIAFRLTKIEGLLLSILCEREMVRKADLHSCVYAGKLDDKVAEEKIIDVWVCKMRRRLKVFGIEIQTLWGQGYYMKVADKEKVKAVINDFERDIA